MLPTSIEADPLPSRSTAGFPPISRLEQSNTHRRCTTLRTTLSATLNLLRCSLSRTADRLIPLSSAQILKQMYAVYNIDDDGGPVDLSDVPSLADLKGVCIAMHERRRQVFAALLAIQVEPYECGWGVWRLVIRELSGLTRIMAEFTRELSRALDDEQRNRALSKMHLFRTC